MASLPEPVSSGQAFQEGETKIEARLTSLLLGKVFIVVPKTSIADGSLLTEVKGLTLSPPQL